MQSFSVTSEALRPQRILLVEDNPGDATLTGERLADAPDAIWDVCHATTLAAALQHLANMPVDAVILDLNLPDSHGLDTLKRVRRATADTPIAVVSGHVDEALRQRALAKGATEVFAKGEVNNILFSRSILYLVQRYRVGQQHAWLERLLETTPDGILVVSRSGVVEYVNQAALTLFGRTREDLVGELLGFSVQEGVPTEIVIPRSGCECVCEMRVVEISWNEGPAYLASLRDVTDRNFANARIRLLQSANLAIAEAEDLHSALTFVLRLVCETAGWHYAGAWIPDPVSGGLRRTAVWHTDDPRLAALAECSGKTTFVSDTAAVGRAWRSGQHERLTTDDFPEILSAERLALWRDVGLTAIHAFPICAAADTLAVLAFAVLAGQEGGGAIVETIAALSVQLGTALARKRAEDALRKNMSLLEAAMSVAHLGTWVSDLQSGPYPNCRVEWSRGTFGIFGLDEAHFSGTAASFVDMVHPDDRAELASARQRAVDGDHSYNIEYRIMRSDGAVRRVRQVAKVQRDDAGVPVRLLGVLQDITDQHLVEEQLRQAQKMEAIGNLTGGLAHDFNNILGVIIGSLDLARPAPPEISDLVEEAIGAAMRGADLTRSLLAFSRRQPLRPSRVALDEVVDNAVRLLRRVLGENIEILLRNGTGLWSVVVDAAQLETCLVNLANNARDAMPMGGRLSIATENRYLDAEYAARHAEVTPGDYVAIEVSDTGSGIPPEVLNRIFEPFFTTKDPGKGTGLGLSMVFGFIKQSGGHITAYSEPGVGTTFRLYLPRALAEGEVDAPPSLPAAARARGETVLVVEDNATLRRVVVRQLSDLGYVPLEADDPKVAFTLLGERHVDLLFTDIVMPGTIDGFTLARLVMASWPKVKILLTSGFPGTNLGDELGLQGDGVRLITKPYRREELAHALREVIDA